MDSVPPSRWSPSFRLLLLAVALATVVGGGAAVTLSASASDGDANPSASIPKSQLPANINPEKAPVFDQSQIKPKVATPLSVQQQIQQAKTWAAQDPNTRLVCFNADGSVAGGADLDRVDPGSPLSATAAAEFCNRMAPGSHP